MRGTLTIERDAQDARIHLKWVDHCSASSTCTLRVNLQRLQRLAQACNITVAERIACSESLTFSVGPFPILGQRSPNFGELLVANLLCEESTDLLYPFQQAGVHWLKSRDQAILADDMGLGKTVQVICALKSILHQEIGRRALVVCPKTLVPNWLREATRWAPHVVFKSLDVVPVGSLTGSAHVIVCSYEQLANGARLLGCNWDLVIADEAHRLRTGESNRAKQFRRLLRQRCWLLTGTPIENDEEDLANLLSILDPAKFSAEFLLGAPQVVRPTAQPYVLRRKKSEVLKELPAARRIDVELEMGPEQLAKYLDIALNRDREIRPTLQRLALCRSLCDFEPITGQSPKIDWLCKFITYEVPAGEKVVVFSAYLPVLSLAYQRLNAVAHGSTKLVSGETPGDERERIVALFQQDVEPRVLLLSLGVGAEGLTLVRANHVVFLNEWWNPSINEQARDRLIRIGQHQNVFEYRLIMQRSVEQRVRTLVAEKSLIVRQVVDALAGSGTCSTELEQLL